MESVNEMDRPCTDAGFPWRKLLAPLGGLVAAGAIISAALLTYDEPPSIPPGTVAAHVAHREALVGRPLLDFERDAIARQLLDEELLVREAARMGFHLSDPDIRKHMARLALVSLPFVSNEPTEEDLVALLDTDPGRYRTRRRVTFEHFFFQEDAEAARRLAEALSAGATVPKTAGDRFWLGRRMEAYSSGQLLTVLGHDFVQALKDAPRGDWVGPVQSGRGWHVLKLEEVHPSQTLPETELQQRLRQDWLAQQRQAAMHDWFNTLREQNGLDPLPSGAAANLRRFEGDQMVPFGW